MICNVCGRDNPDEARFCDRCGNALRPQAAATTGPTVNLEHADREQDNPPARSASGAAAYARMYPAPYVQPQESGKALLALLLSIVSFLGPALLTAVPAILLGYAARDEIRRSNGLLTGEGMAQWALVLGWINVALSLLGFCFVCLAFAAPLGMLLDL